MQLKLCRLPSLKIQFLDWLNPALSRSFLLMTTFKPSHYTCSTKIPALFRIRVWNNIINLIEIFWKPLELRSRGFRWPLSSRSTETVVQQKIHGQVWRTNHSTVRSRENDVCLVSVCYWKCYVWYYLLIYLYIIWENMVWERIEPWECFYIIRM